jgi:2-amino-4-hydroxy-6-hydroxymethyldihydropteridine diphosphokinase
MILIGLGSNQDGPWGNPRETIEQALRELGRAPLRLIKASTLIVTAPFGKTDQPNFVNAVASVATELAAESLLSHLHQIERDAGRVRGERWGPRALDLDVLDFDGVISDNGLTLPHPGIAERRFVLDPIAEIAPEWRHPVTRMTAGEMRARVRSLR